MIWLLDSNAWIHYLKNINSPVRTHLQDKPEEDIRTCSVVYAELIHGALKYGNPDRRLQTVRKTLAPYHSLAFDDAAAAYYATLRHNLELQGKIIGSFDLLIAAICLVHDCTLVTNNVAEFRRVTGLRIEDWSQPVPA